MIVRYESTRHKKKPKNDDITPTFGSISYPSSSAETSSQSQQHPERNKPFYHTQMLHGTGIFIYIWLNFMVNVGKYSIHGEYGIRVFPVWLRWFDFLNTQVILVGLNSNFTVAVISAKT